MGPQAIIHEHFNQSVVVNGRRDEWYLHCRQRMEPFIRAGTSARIAVRERRDSHVLSLALLCMASG